jgi:hypothetical protein
MNSKVLIILAVLAICSNLSWARSRGQQGNKHPNPGRELLSFSHVYSLLALKEEN